MELLKRAFAQRFASVSAVVGSTFTIWLEADGVEIPVPCIGGKITDSGKPLPMGGFMRSGVYDVTVMVALASLPAGYALKEGTRFHASASGTRATAKPFKIDSWDDASQLASHVEIRGVKGK